MKRLLAIAASAEALTGLALLVLPAVVIRLLLGSGGAGVELLLGRIVGAALIALAIACWPAQEAPRTLRQQCMAMLAYSGSVALLFSYVGLIGLGGPLLWPAALFHAAMTALLAMPWAPARNMSH